MFVFFFINPPPPPRKNRKRKYKVNIGCGRTPTTGWLNFDNTQAIQLANSPVKYWLAKIFGLNSHQIENIEWNKKNKIRFADATKKIPLPDAAAECIYTSHMFEHLSQNGAKSFLKEALRVLEARGVLRIAVPDLRAIISEYNRHEDADRFMDAMLVTAPPFNSMKQKISLLISGYRHHQWMYDGASLSRLMTKAGFHNVSILEPGKTLIANPINLDLSERSEQSVYVEGVK